MTTSFERYNNIQNMNKVDKCHCKHPVPVRKCDLDFEGGDQDDTNVELVNVS